MSLYFYNAKIIDGNGQPLLTFDGIVEFDIDGTYKNEKQLKGKILKSAMDIYEIQNMKEFSILLTKLNKL